MAEGCAIVTGAGSGIGTAAFRRDRFTSPIEVRPAQQIGAALAQMMLEPPGCLNGRILRYHPSGWERTNG